MSQLLRLLALLALAAAAAASSAAERIHLVVLHTNDIHGQVLPRPATWIRDVSPTPQTGGLELDRCHSLGAARVSPSGRDAICRGFRLRY